MDQATSWGKKTRTCGSIVCAGGSKTGRCSGYTSRHKTFVKTGSTTKKKTCFSACRGSLWFYSSGFTLRPLSTPGWMIRTRLLSFGPPPGLTRKAGVCGCRFYVGHVILFVIYIVSIGLCRRSVTASGEIHPNDDSMWRGSLKTRSKRLAFRDWLDGC